MDLSTGRSSQSPEASQGLKYRNTKGQGAQCEQKADREAGMEYSRPSAHHLGAFELHDGLARVGVGDGVEHGLHARAAPHAEGLLDDARPRDGGRGHALEAQPGRGGGP